VATWGEFAAEAPHVAERARAFLEARKHLTLATLRRDGAPRISGIEVQILGGDLWMGSMWRSPKALDLRRDPRFALHSSSIDPPEWTGDAKVAGRAVETHDEDTKARIVAAAGGAPSGPFHLFRLEIDEVVVIALGDPPDHLAVRRWTAADGVREHELR
jgi:hypothetical protein